MPVDEVRRLLFIREETRFEVGVLNDRVNALISAEAFLMIAFTMATVNSSARSPIFFGLIAPFLSLVGFALAILAWPGINTSFNIIIEWNSRLLRLLRDDPVLPSRCGGNLT